MQVKVTQSCLTLCNTMDQTAHAILEARILEWVAFPFFGALPNPGIKHRSPALQVDSLSSEPPGKPKNTGVGSLSLLQGNFPTQESKLGSPALQIDSLPAELPGKPRVCLLLLLSRFSRVRLCATPQTAAHQAPPSLGFSRQGVLGESFNHGIWISF